MGGVDEGHPVVPVVPPGGVRGGLDVTDNGLPVNVPDGPPPVLDTDLRLVYLLPAPAPASLDSDHNRMFTPQTRPQDASSPSSRPPAVPARRTGP